MTTSAVFDVIDALVDATTEAVGDLAFVYDGFGVTDEPGDFLMVGVEDPDIEAASTAAETRQEWAHANHTARDEEGEITCAALSWNGDGDQRLARQTVRDIVAAVEAVLRAEPTLGLPNVLWTSFGTDLQLNQAQGEQGAEALVIFKVFFRARLNS